MDELRFIAVEDGYVIVSGDDGTPRRLIIDDALREALRPKTHHRSEPPKVAPREIQQLIRSGKSVDEVVQITGADPQDVHRFEGPILAERGYIVEQARAVTVRIRDEQHGLSGEPSTFGDALDARLGTAKAQGIAWDAWKDAETGWHLTVRFRVDDIDREALWRFEPRADVLSPLNDTAETLSQQGDLDSLGAPRLHAVGGTDTDGGAQGSGAAHHHRVTPQFTGATPRLRVTEEATRAQMHETADLLEALRRRRGEREPVTLEDDFDQDPSIPERDRETVPVVPMRRRFPVATTVSDAPSGSDSTRSTERTSSDTEDTAEIAPEPGEDEGPSGSNPPAEPSDAERVERASATRTNREPSPRPQTGEPRRDTAEHEALHRASVGKERAVDVPLAGLEPEPGDQDAGRDGRTQSTTGSLGKRRSSRPSMPSWDEIVFGTKKDT